MDTVMAYAFGGSFITVATLLLGVVLAITWLDLPFILMCRLSKMTKLMEQMNGLLRLVSGKANKIERNIKPPSESVARGARLNA